MTARDQLQVPPPDAAQLQLELIPPAAMDQIASWLQLDSDTQLS